jgi:hypothetical protein
MPRPALVHTVEYDRIAALPRRALSQADAAVWARVLTDHLREPGATCELRPWQGLALAEAAEHRGAWLALPVGLGKTLISYLLPTLLGARAPVLVIPAALRDKTWSDFAAYRGQWRAPRNPCRVISREELALERSEHLLDEIAPDLMTIDEADEHSNSSSAAVRRIDRYRCSHLDAAYVCMTGTPSRTSTMGYWHQLCWCLLDGAPVPLTESEAQAWAAVLDHRVRDPGNRPHPGPLGANRGAAVAWFARRLRETPGVVIVDGDSCDAPLTVRTRAAREDSALDEAFAKFALEFENPGGVCVSDPLSRWLLDGQLGCGLYTRWNPEPPKEWREARRDIAKFVRDKIAHSTRSRRPLDTELQVLRRYPAHPIVVRWLDVRSTFDPVTETIWISSATLDSAIEWIHESDAPGIVWCGSIDFGERLARETGLPYYGRRGISTSGVPLHRAPKQSMIVSWNANKKGHNLQAWTRQLIIMPPQSAKWLEQIFGRSHRSGQDQPVTADVLVTSGGTIDSFEAAIGEAQFARDSVGMTQKILRADIQRATIRKTPSNKYRWATRNKERHNDTSKIPAKRDTNRECA